MSDHERLAELELRYMEQQEVLEELDRQLMEADRTISLLRRRLERLETTNEELVRIVLPPSNEKPPHY